MKAPKRTHLKQSDGTPACNHAGKDPNLTRNHALVDCSFCQVVIEYFRALGRGHGY